MRIPKTWMIALFITMLTAGLVHAADEKAPEKKDTISSLTHVACNIWYEEEVISCINYKRGKIIQAGDEIKNLQIGMGEEGLLRGFPLIRFHHVESETDFTIKFIPDFFPNWDVKDYCKAYFTKKDFDELTKGMTEQEIKGIQEGKLYVGMSKQAVKTAYGIPPQHRTESMKEDSWVFWTSKLRQKVVYFDEKGRAMREPDSKDENEI
ncbi:MAG: hypothetical protein ACLFQ6_12045 [Candidatus Sumerlaeia bacterium]